MDDATLVSEVSAMINDEIGLGTLYRPGEEWDGPCSTCAHQASDSVTMITMDDGRFVRVTVEVLHP
jgi:hypothetical protein